jgi:DNA-binding response OmpR family regulator
MTSENRVKFAALFVNKSRLAAITQDLAPFGIELLAANSVAGILQKLKHSEAAAVLVEDDPTEIVDWLAVLRMRMTTAVPVIVVGAPRGLGMAEALRNGATDFIDYDGSFAQLLARLQARVGAQCADARQRMEVGPYVLCASNSSIRCHETEINLTAREFALAWVLFSSEGRVVSLPSLSARVWGRSDDVCKRTLEQHIYKLRRKLAADSTATRLRIQAIYGIGYRLDIVAARTARALAAADPHFAAPSFLAPSLALESH